MQLSDIEEIERKIALARMLGRHIADLKRAIRGKMFNVLRVCDSSGADEVEFDAVVEIPHVKKHLKAALVRAEAQLAAL